MTATGRATVDETQRWPAKPSEIVARIAGPDAPDDVVDDAMRQLDELYADDLARARNDRKAANLRHLFGGHQR